MWVKLITFLLLALQITQASPVNESADLPESFIINGQPATDAHRSVAAIVSFQVDQAPFGFLFTGSLISNQHVLTVAQALHNYVRWHVGLGNNNREEMQYFDSNRAIIHSEYNAQLLQNNIGIIILPQSIPPFVAFPIPLPPENHISSPMYRYFGFGITNADDINSAAYNLKYGFTSEVNIDECRNIFGSLLITPGTWCGQQFNTGLCHGDQGGPMLHFFDNYITGMASHWMEPCNGGFPDVFVSVIYYNQWINDTISQPIPDI